jgi:ribosome-associated toxin RatA of RatAB toxin-antitoxin module
MILLGTLAAVLLAAAPDPVVSQRMTGDMANIYEMKGSFDVAAPAEVVWSTLTDYASHPRFVSDLKSSVVREKREGETLVAQEATTQVAMFSATVQLLLSMKETSGVQILFTDTLRKDFEVFDGKWSVSKNDQGLHVDYALRCRPKAKAPGFIVAPIMAGSTRRLMVAMRTEIEKRAFVTLATR